MGNPTKIAAISDHKLPAPDCAVRAVAGSIEGHADYRFIQAVFGHDRNDMGMVMLHADLRQRQFFGVFCRQILRMQVVGDDFRCDIKKGFIELNGICIVLIGR